MYGLQRRASSPNTLRIDHLYDNPKYPSFVTIYGDLSESSSLLTILSKITPDEIYNLGAQSHVKVSFDVPEYTANVTGIGALRLLDAIRQLKLPTKYYQASSSEMFGDVGTEELQNESTPFNPQSPYGLAKVFAYHITKIYRKSYGMYAANGILFNHESPRRGVTFVTRKITIGLSQVKLGLQKTLKLGNLSASRDWGYAKDYVEGIWKILQHPKPDDFVLATGETHTIREFVELATQHLNIDLVWKGKGLEEVGINRKSNKVIIEIDPAYFRPSEVNYLKGDASKAHKMLNWKPKVTFQKLVEIMIKSDYDSVKAELKSGKKISVKKVNLFS